MRLTVTELLGQAKAVPTASEPGRRFTGFDLANIDIIERHLMDHPHIENWAAV